MRPDDFYDLEALISEEDRERLERVREFMQDEFAPIINDFWRREEFPHEIVPGLAELEIGGLAFHGHAVAVAVAGRSSTASSRWRSPPSTPPSPRSTAPRTAS
jgi:alkylation response protein AidB-like acyl-CoA dehydrogenase